MSRHRTVPCLSAVFLSFCRTVPCLSVTINDQPYYEGVIVIRDSKTQRFYVHEVITEKRTDMSFKTGADNKVGKSGDTSSPSIISLLDKIRVVKQKMLTREVDNNKYIQKGENNSKEKLQFSFARTDDMSLVEQAEELEKELQSKGESPNHIRKKIWEKYHIIRDSDGKTGDSSMSFLEPSPVFLSFIRTVPCLSYIQYKNARVLLSVLLKNKK